MVKILVIAPIIGSSGEATNERQVVMAISRFSEKVLVISPTDIRDIFKGMHNVYLAHRPLNVKVVLIPSIPPYGPLWLLSFLIHIFFMLLLIIVIYFLDLRSPFDIIYVRDPRVGLPISFINRLAKKTFVKIASIAEEEVYQKLLKKIVEVISSSIDKHVMKNVAGIITHSQNFAKHLVLRRRCLPKKVIILPPGITWTIINIVKKYCPRRSTKDEIIVGFLGLLAEWQGVDILCDIVAELIKKGYKAKLKVIGDGVLKGYLARKCNEKKVKVEITGFLPHHIALCLARRKFDVLVLPRIHTETTSNIIPIKIVEALVLGIPVIVTDLPIYKKLRGKGLCVSKRTPKHFADAVLKIFESNSDISHSIDHKFLKDFIYEHNVAIFLKIALGDKM